MGSWIRCLCGGLVHTNMFSGTHICRLIEDSDYDAIDDPVDRDKLRDLYFNKGVTVYRCLNCGRLLVEWDNEGAPTFYLPEGKRDEVTGTEPAKDNDQRLKELEAMAEAAYTGMYDSISPTECYSRAKEAFYDAIALANRMGRQPDVERLESRLQHVKEVFRHQFT